MRIGLKNYATWRIQIQKRKDEILVERVRRNAQMEKEYLDAVKHRSWWARLWHPTPPTIEEYYNPSWWRFYPSDYLSGRFNRLEALQKVLIHEDDIKFVYINEDEFADVWGS